MAEIVVSPAVAEGILEGSLESAELSHSLKSFGSSSKHRDIGPESFGIVVCLSVGTAPCFVGLAQVRFEIEDFRPDP